MCNCAYPLHISPCRYGVEVHNFTSSWSDGQAFCALAHRHWPELLNYETEVDAGEPHRNLERAFAVFEQIGVDGLLDPEGTVKHS